MPASPRPLNELHAWLALRAAPGLGRKRARHLLHTFGNPLAVFEVPDASLDQALGPGGSQALRSAVADSLPALECTQDWLARHATHQVLSLSDPRYPAPLQNTADPPLLLFARGSLAWLSAPLVALVGSRHATPLGRGSARRFAGEFSARGVTVVSGLAVGIDAAAHEGALDAHEGAPADATPSPGSTIAVVASGLDRVYPPRHQDLAERVAQRGLMLSEYPLGTPAIPQHFPMRNRIIAGLTRAVVVVEAAMRSGSLITARLAAEAGRDVYAVPGSLSNPQSAGCHRLIKQGAGLFDQVDDVLKALPWAFRPDPPRPGPDAGPTSPGAEAAGRAVSTPTAITFEAAMPTKPPPSGAPGDLIGVATASAGSSAEPVHTLVTALLRSQPCSLEELVAASGHSAQELHVSLMLAELEGKVGRLPGGLFQWCER